MSMEENKAAALRSIDEVWSKGNPDVVDELYDANYVYHEPYAGEVQGARD